MGEAYISKRGGSSRVVKGYAFIVVTYPADSTCTCSLEHDNEGTVTYNPVYTSTSKNGSVVFTVPEAGTWVVRIENGYTWRVWTVEIARPGQIERLTLSYTFKLVEGGKIVEPGAWKSSAQTNAAAITSLEGCVEISFGYGGAGYGSGYARLVDLTSYSTLKVIGRQTASANGNATGIKDPGPEQSATDGTTTESPGVGIIDLPANRCVFNTDTFKEQTVASIAEKTGYWWVGFWGAANASPDGMSGQPEKIEIKEMYLE